jgi:hypothetical protein
VDNSGNVAEDDIKKLIKSLDPVENVNERQDLPSEPGVHSSETGGEGKVENFENAKKEDTSEGQARIENESPVTEQFKYVQLLTSKHFLGPGGDCVKAIKRYPPDSEFFKLSKIIHLLLLNTVGILSKINVNFFTEFLTMR